MGWIVLDEVNNRMAPAHAVRILDGLSVDQPVALTIVTDSSRPDVLH